MKSLNRLNYGKENPFTKTAQATVHNPLLSFLLFGLLTRIFSLPQDWVFELDTLSRKLGIQRKTLERYIKKLIALGFAVRYRVSKRDPQSGQFIDTRTLYAFFEEPVSTTQKLEAIEYLKELYRRDTHRRVRKCRKNNTNIPTGCIKNNKQEPAAPKAAAAVVVPSKEKAQEEMADASLDIDKSLSKEQAPQEKKEFPLAPTPPLAKEEDLFEGFAFSKAQKERFRKTYPKERLVQVLFKAKEMQAQKKIKSSVEGWIVRYLSNGWTVKTDSKEFMLCELTKFLTFLNYHKLPCETYFCYDKEKNSLSFSLGHGVSTYQSSEPTRENLRAWLRKCLDACHYIALVPKSNLMTALQAWN